MYQTLSWDTQPRVKADECLQSLISLQTFPNLLPSASLTFQFLSPQVGTAYHLSRIVNTTTYWLIKPIPVYAKALGL